MNSTGICSRQIVIEDLVTIVEQGDKVAPEDSIVGVHLDNVHRLTAEGLAEVFNGFLKAVQAAKYDGRISQSRKIGYIAKNNPKEFKRALDQGLMSMLPLYQINENAKLNEVGLLDNDSRRAQQIGQQYCIPVFLKTFGSDVAYTIQRNNRSVNVYVSEDMTARMAQMPNISGAAWSADEGSYHPTVFIQGTAVPNARLPFGYCPLSMTRLFKESLNSALSHLSACLFFSRNSRNAKHAFLGYRGVVDHQHGSAATDEPIRLDKQFCFHRRCIPDAGSNEVV